MHYKKLSSLTSVTDSINYFEYFAHQGGTEILPHLKMRFGNLINPKIISILVNDEVNVFHQDNSIIKHDLRYSTEGGLFRPITEEAPSYRVSSISSNKFFEREKQFYPEEEYYQLLDFLRSFQFNRTQLLFFQEVRLFGDNDYIFELLNIQRDFENLQFE